MPDFEKIGKTLDNKMRGFAENSKKTLVNKKGEQEQLSDIKLLIEEQNEIFMQLGKEVYEKEELEELSTYNETIKKIQTLQQKIDDKTKEESRVCSKCGIKLSDTAMFCPNCGTGVNETQEKTIQCSECGAILKNGTKFCVKCGEKL